jgi:tryptophan synthase alpha chain
MSQNPKTRIATTFEKLHGQGCRGLIPYLTAGDPAPERSVELLLALEEGGADIIELGVPFSDPIADGPVIQRASDRALRAGTNLKKVLGILRDLRRHSQIPVVMFSYLNPVLQYGWERFAADAAEAGADGALLIDLNAEEATPYVSEMKRYNLDAIFLVSQTTKEERLRLISNFGSGFVYLVSRAGVTGMQSAVSERVAPLIERVRRVTPLPLAVGFGLSKREHMAALAPYADAAIVGSAVMQIVEQSLSLGGAQQLPEKLRALAADLKQGLAVTQPARS